MVRRKGFSTTIDSSNKNRKLFRFFGSFYFSFDMGAYWFRPDCKRFRSRVVVGRQATLKVDHSFNCRSSVFSGSLVKLLRAMAPARNSARSSSASRVLQPGFICAGKASRWVAARLGQPGFIYRHQGQLQATKTDRREKEGHGHRIIIRG